MSAPIHSSHSPHISEGYVRREVEKTEGTSEQVKTKEVAKHRFITLASLFGAAALVAAAAVFATTFTAIVIPYALPIAAALAALGVVIILTDLTVQAIRKRNANNVTTDDKTQNAKSEEPASQEPKSEDPRIPERRSQELEDTREVITDVKQYSH